MSEAVRRGTGLLAHAADDQAANGTHGRSGA